MYNVLHIEFIMTMSKWKSIKFEFDTTHKPFILITSIVKDIYFNNA